MEFDLIGQDLVSLQDVNWEKAKRCESVNLHFNRLTNTIGLPALSTIIELNLSSNHFKACDLPELTKLPALVSLDLSGNKISSLQKLPYLPNLRNLSIAFNFLTGLDDIHIKLPYLEQFDIRGNQVARSSDLDPLGELHQLRVLFIGGPQQNPVCNRVSNLTRLFQICESLQYVDDKPAYEWRNMQLVEAPTPRFDELAHRHRHPPLSSSSGKKSGSNSAVDRIRTAHTPSTSKVLFPPAVPSGVTTDPGHFQFPSSTHTAPHGIAITPRTASQTRPAANTSNPWATKQEDEEREVILEPIHHTHHHQVAESETKQIHAHHQQDEHEQRQQDHHLPSHMASSLIKLSVINERNRYHNLLHSFHKLKLHVYTYKTQQQMKEALDQMHILESKITQQEQQIITSQVTQQATLQATLQAEYDMRILQEKQKFDVIQRKFIQQQEKNEECRKEIERLKSSQNITEQEKNIQRDQIIEQRTVMEELNLQVINYQKSEVQRTQQNHTLDLELRKLEELVQGKESELMNQSKEMEYCQRRLQDNEQANQQMKALLQTLTNTLHAKEEAIKIKNEEKEHLQHQLAELQLMHKQQADHSLQTLHSELAETQHKLLQSERKLEEYLSNRLETRLVTLQQAFEEISQHNTELQHENVELRARHAHDRKTMKDLTKCIKKLQALEEFQRHKTCDKCQHYESELRVLSQAFDELKQAKDELEHDKHETQHLTLQQLTQLEEATKDIDKSKQALETVIKVKEAIINDQQQQIEHLQHKQTTLIQDLEHTKTQANELNDQVTDLKAEVMEMDFKLRSKQRIEQKVKGVVKQYLETQLQISSSSSSQNNMDLTVRQRLSRSLEKLSRQQYGHSDEDGVGGDEEEFLALLEDMDGIALTHQQQQHHEQDDNDRPPRHYHKEHQQQHMKYDQDAVIQQPNQQGCRNLQCQQTRHEIEDKLQRAYEKLTVQKIEFERAYAIKNEEYLRVSESLVRVCHVS